MVEEKMSFNQWIRKKRKDSNYTVKELSELTEISKPYINKIENGKQKNCSIHIILILIEVFGYNLAEAYEEVDFKK